MFMSGSTKPEKTVELRAVREEDRDAVLALDRRATGEDRSLAVGVAWTARWRRPTCRRWRCARPGRALPILSATRRARRRCCASLIEPGLRLAVPGVQPRGGAAAVAARARASSRSRGCAAARAVAVAPRRGLGRLQPLLRLSRASVGVRRRLFLRARDVLRAARAAAGRVQQRAHVAGALSSRPARGGRTAGARRRSAPSRRCRRTPARRGGEASQSIVASARGSYPPATSTSAGDSLPSTASSSVSTLDQPLAVPGGDVGGGAERAAELPLDGVAGDEDHDDAVAAPRRGRADPRRGRARATSSRTPRQAELARERVPRGRDEPEQLLAVRRALLTSPDACGATSVPEVSSMRSTAVTASLQRSGSGSLTERDGLAEHNPSSLDHSRLDSRTVGAGGDQPQPHPVAEDRARGRPSRRARQLERELDVDPGDARGRRRAAWRRRSRRGRARGRGRARPTRPSSRSSAKPSRGSPQRNALRAVRGGQQRERRRPCRDRSRRRG